MVHVQPLGIVQQLGGCRGVGGGDGQSQLGRHRERSSLGRDRIKCPAWVLTVVKSYVCVCMYVKNVMCVCMYVCMYIRIYECMYMRMYVSMYLQMYLSMYV